MTLAASHIPSASRICSSLKDPEAYWSFGWNVLRHVKSKCPKSHLCLCSILPPQPVSYLLVPLSHDPAFMQIQNSEPSSTPHVSVSHLSVTRVIFIGRYTLTYTVLAVFNHSMALSTFILSAVLPENFHMAKWELCAIKHQLPSLPPPPTKHSSWPCCSFYFLFPWLWMFLGPGARKASDLLLNCTWSLSVYEPGFSRHRGAAGRLQSSSDCRDSPSAASLSVGEQTLESVWRLQKHPRNGPSIWTVTLRLP